jgi:hypothetical protein
MKTSTITTITALVLLMIPAIVAGQGIDEQRDTEIHMPSFSELAEGWNTMKPGGETSCAHGDEYQFFVFPGDPKKLKIYFNGGGGCWNAQLCSPDHEPTLYVQKIEHDQNPAWLARQFGAAPGVLDHTHPDNPFGDYTMVHVPYCTGDLHLGNRDAEYTLHHDEGSVETFTIRHRGQTNAIAVLDWVYQNLNVPETVFISGGSAGGMAVAYYLSVLADHYSGAKVVALADDIGSYRAEEMNSLDHRKWGIPDVLPDKDRWGLLWDQGFDMADLIIRGGTGLDNGRIYMFDHAYDYSQLGYIQLVSGQPANVLELITTNREIIRDKLPELRSYTAGGMKHTILFDPLFYKVQTDGARLTDWVASIAAGDEVHDIHCSNCIRTGFVFDEDDLRIIEYAIELLSVPGQWNAQQIVPGCPQDSDTFSLVCAVIDGARSTDALTAISPILVWYPAVLWDVINASAELLDEYPSALAPLSYNNRPDATQEEMVELLKAIRKRIVAGLDMAGKERMNNY